MINFRKLRQDFSSNILKEGKELFEKNSILQAKILHLDGNIVRLAARVKGAFENIYECEIEIDRHESMAIDSNCDCPYTFDCQHIAAFLFYLEVHLDEILVAYSKENDFEKSAHLDDVVKKEIKATIETAKNKEEVRKDQVYQKEILGEYVAAASVLSSSPFFLPHVTAEEDKAELGIILAIHPQEKNLVDCQIALRLPFRSKPLIVPNVRAFIDALFYREEIFLAARRLRFSLHSFGEETKEILEILIPHLRYSNGEERGLRTASFDFSAFGLVLERACQLAQKRKGHSGEKEPLTLPSLFINNLEEPLCFSLFPCSFHIDIDYLEAPAPTFLLRPCILIEEERVKLDDVLTFESTRPGLIYKNIYFRFQPKIKRCHLKALKSLSDLAIPEHLFGTFIENSLPSLKEYAEVIEPTQLKEITTLPYVGDIKGRLNLSYLDGELEAKLFFLYENKEIPAAPLQLNYQHISHFISKKGIVARNVVEEKALMDELFEDFLFDEKEGLFRCKSEKKIVEFMTDVIPKHSHNIKFECPENLADQFIYDNTTLELDCTESPDRIDLFQIAFKVNGHLKGVSLDLLYECIASKKGFLELQTVQTKDKKKKNRLPKILVLDLEKLTPLVQLLDEISIKKIDDHVEMRPLWNLASLHVSQFQGLPIKFSLSPKLLALQKQILGEKAIETSDVPAVINADLRKYQFEGVKWLERLRLMHLNGILADDMGLGKTLQAIIAITQAKIKNPKATALVVCPTSLLYNWQAEFNKFNAKLETLVVDGAPQHRRKLLKETKQPDIFITSYNLLQKDVEIYKTLPFDYLILDEGQYIKNRTTRNAKSVKQLNAVHRLILTGTPIENSLEELWSLFDFLMPGLLSSFDRFVDKYIRSSSNQMEALKRKVSPFILRRMKEDVLDDLPPVTEILYHCHLTDRQRDLYHSYAASAKEELVKLVKKEGFEKVQIHVLATLTRLKQICCHPAIFAKERAENGDSAKYDMLMELVPNLIESKRKTIIFSQYTKMLGIIRQDLQERGIPFAYLDGSTKNRLEIVNEFNENPALPIFLVSLKAGGSGLNLVGADTVIHYDMWWNPAVENQALDRVHRIGQKKSVSSYKLVTLNTIEEKITQLHNKKRGLVKKVISSDDDAISKLTWEEVLELLQT